MSSVDKIHTRAAPFAETDQVYSTSFNLLGVTIERDWVGWLIIVRKGDWNTERVRKSIQTIGRANTNPAAEGKTLKALTQALDKLRHELTDKDIAQDEDPWLASAERLSKHGRSAAAKASLLHLGVKEVADSLANTTKVKVSFSLAAWVKASADKDTLDWLLVLLLPEPVSLSLAAWVKASADEDSLDWLLILLLPEPVRSAEADGRASSGWVHATLEELDHLWKVQVNDNMANTAQSWLSGAEGSGSGPDGASSGGTGGHRILNSGHDTGAHATSVEVLFSRKELNTWWKSWELAVVRSAKLQRAADVDLAQTSLQEIDNPWDELADNGLAEGSGDGVARAHAGKVAGSEADTDSALLHQAAGPTDNGAADLALVEVFLGDGLDGKPWPDGVGWAVADLNAEVELLETALDPLDKLWNVVVDDEEAEFLKESIFFLLAKLLGHFGNDLLDLSAGEDTLDEVHDLCADIALKAVVLLLRQSDSVSAIQGDWAGDWAWWDAAKVELVADVEDAAKLLDPIDDDVHVSNDRALANSTAGDWHSVADSLSPVADFNFGFAFLDHLLDGTNKGHADLAGLWVYARSKTQQQEHFEI